MSAGEEGARVGVFGGTFNPIHLGHLRAAEEIAEALGLSRVLFVPNAQPPHKAPSAGCGEVIAPAAQRVAWVEAALEERPGFEVSRIEIEREGPSFLVDTLEQLRQELRPARPVFFLGQDAFADLGNWRSPERILELSDLAVTARPPVLEDALERWMPENLRDPYVFGPDGRSARHERAGTRIELVSITALDISASAVRERVREGRSVRYLLPERVRRAVLDSGCYAVESR